VLTKSESKSKRVRTFHIDRELDIALKKRAAEEDKRFSDIVEEALSDYLTRKKEKSNGSLE
jgi:predicted transcriptional regulator